MKTNPTNETNQADIIQNLITKSEDDFEKKVTYISAGALLLSLTFIEKIIQLENSLGKYFLIGSWIFLILSLLVNLVSHLISKIQLRKTQQEIYDDLPYEKQKLNYRVRLIITESLNWASVVLLILGIAFILIFASINTMNPQIKKEQNNSKNDTLKVQIIHSKT